MGLKQSYAHPEQNDLDFTSGLGWLAAIAFIFAMILFVASFYIPDL
jgi:hypothetical protein